MSNLKKYFAPLIIMLLLSACVADRNDRGNQANDRNGLPYESGAIFKSGINERPLFEARRARNIGDGIIMTVVDATPVKKADSKEKKEGKDRDESDEEDSRRDRRSRDDGEEPDLTNVGSDVLLGPVTMTVVDILESGNMLITGGRQVLVDGENKYIRVTGIVDPINLVGGNTIQSTQVAEVRIQIDNVRVRADGSTSRINEGNSVFGNYFQSVRPR